MNDADEMSATMEKALRVRVGDDPRWRRLGNVSEMGVLPGIRWATYLAGIGVRTRRIPGAAWALEEDVAVIACPCGNEAKAVADAYPKSCRPEVEQNLCQRAFFFDGENAYAFNTPSDVPATIRVDDTANAGAA